MQNAQIQNIEMLKFYFITVFILLIIPFVGQTQKTDNHRLIVLADMGNESDEEQQILHLLMCSNDIDLEGLIAVTGKYLHPESRSAYKQQLHPELFLQLIKGYEKVVKNLRLHDKNYLEPSHLRSIVRSGQTGYGIAATGEGLSTEGSKLIIEAAEKEDKRPLYIVVNAGSNTLAQAIKDYRKTHSQAELEVFIAKFRVFENGAQDDAGAWICHEFPKIHWIRSNYQTYCYAGPSWDGTKNNKGDIDNLGPHTWQPYAYSGMGQHQWALEHIIGDHGAFGRLYPLRQLGRGMVYLEGGGTIPFLGLLNKGLTSSDHPHWGGWSGRYTKEKAENVWSKHQSVNDTEKVFTPFFAYKEAKDKWTDEETGITYDNIYAPIWRWRRAFFNDLQCRMDWCTASFEEANHHPIAVVNKDTSDQILQLFAKAGETITLDTSTSYDPDNDALTILWWHYQEAGTYPTQLALNNTAQLNFRVPQDALGKEIHLILEVKDENKIASLYDYRRIVIEVKE